MLLSKWGLVARDFKTTGLRAGITSGQLLSAAWVCETFKQNLLHHQPDLAWPGGARTLFAGSLHQGSSAIYQEWREYWDPARCRWGCKSPQDLPLWQPPQVYLSPGQACPYWRLSVSYLWCLPPCTSAHPSQVDFFKASLCTCHQSP